MAVLLSSPTGNSQRKIHSLKIDMTPLVDLGFLLITFFVFTAALSEPTLTRLIMPKAGDDMPVAQSRALTVLLDKEKAWVYEGLFSEAIALGRVKEAGYDLQRGWGTLVQQKQNRLSDKEELVVLIKPLKSAAYQNLIDALDEMQIHNVKRYAIVDVSEEEKAWLKLKH